MPSSLVKIIFIKNLSVCKVIVSLAGEPMQSQMVGDAGIVSILDFRF